MGGPVGQHLLQHAGGRRLADRDRARPARSRTACAAAGGGAGTPPARGAAARPRSPAGSAAARAAGRPGAPRRGRGSRRDRAAASISSWVSGASTSSASDAQVSRSSSTYGDGSRSLPFGRAGRRRACAALLQQPPLVEEARQPVTRPRCLPPSRRTASIHSRPMCGIVGYVGEKSAQDVVIEGLRRLEYRGYDSAGIALVHDGADRSPTRRPASWPTSRRPWSSTRSPSSTTGIGHTRWATHGAPTDRNAHPHLGRHDRVAVIHNGIIENFAELRDELEADGRRDALRHRHRDRRPPARARARDRRRPHRGHAARSASGSSGAFTLVAVDAEDPSRVVAARRNSPLVVGLGEGENFLGSDVAAFIEHTREALELGQDQVVTITREGVEVTGFDGTPAEGTPLPRRLGPLGRREGRPRLVHAQGDLRAAARRRRRAARPPLRRRPAAARRDAALGAGAARRRQDHHHRVRHGVLRRPGREVRHRALDPDPVRGRAGPRVPLPRPDPDPGHPGGGDQPVGRDRRHLDGDPARTHAGVAGAGDLQHQRLDDPARVRRRDLHPRRPGDRRRVDQGLHDPARGVLPAGRSTSRRCAAPSSATRSRDVVHELEQMPGHIQTHPGPQGRDLRAGRASCPARGRCCSSAATPASRSRSRAR